MRLIHRVLLAVCLLGLSLPTRATTVSPVTLPEMTASAQVIFIGTCRVRETSLKPTSVGITVPVSTYSFEVREVLKGDLTEGADFQFDQVGGAAPGLGEARGLQPRGVEPYEVGKEYLLFLKRLSSGWWTPIGMMQGQFTISTAPDGTKQVKNGLNNQWLGIGAAGKAATSGKSAGASGRGVDGSVSLDELKGLVKGYQAPVSHE